MVPERCCRGAEQHACLLELPACSTLSHDRRVLLRRSLAFPFLSISGFAPGSVGCEDGEKR